MPIDKGRDRRRACAYLSGRVGKQTAGITVSGLAILVAP